MLGSCLRKSIDSEANSEEQVASQEEQKGTGPLGSVGAAEACSKR